MDGETRWKLRPLGLKETTKSDSVTQQMYNVIKCTLHNFDTKQRNNVVSRT